MKIKTLLLSALALIVTTPSQAQARDQISIVGSSTVFPFTTLVAEEFGNNTEFRTPIIEATGTGGGFKLFCGGVGPAFPDFNNASRAIHQSEIELCAQNGVKDPVEIRIGSDGIVLANTTSNPVFFSLTRDQVFLALAKLVPENGALINNKYQRWSNIDPSLPNVGIEVYGPPPSSGTRDAFVELVMEPYCLKHDAFVRAYPNKEDRKNACHQLREDNRFIEAGENDNLIVQKLVHNESALGIFGYSFLEQNMDMVKAASLDGVEASFETIEDGSYSLSRPLYVYLKREHMPVIDGMKEFAKELISEDAIGDMGYVTERGLIPTSGARLMQTRNKINEL